MKQNKILLIGDAILDEYIYARATRLSREAPLPVFEYTKTLYKLGGAANVLQNLLALGNKVTIITTTGDDSAGKYLRSIIYRYTEASLIIDVKVTPRKIRIIGEAGTSVTQQVLRLDKICSCTPANFKSNKYPTGYDAIVISDYGLGVALLPSVRKILRQALGNIPIFVDSRSNLDKHPYVTAITPNIEEAESLISNPVEHNNLIELKKTLSVENIILTLGKDGALVCDISDTVTKIPAYNNRAIDITGAGDVILAAFTSYYLETKDPVLSTKKACIAAGISVQSIGTIAITKKQIEEIPC